MSVPLNWSVWLMEWLLNIWYRLTFYSLKLLFNIWEYNSSVARAVWTPWGIRGVSLSFVFFTSCQTWTLGSDHHDRQRGDFLRCYSWCSLWKGKWQRAPLSSWKISCAYHLNLSTVFNSLAEAQKTFTCGFRVCGFITWSESITVSVNLVNSWFSRYIFPFSFNYKELIIRISHTQKTNCLFQQFIINHLMYT